MAEFYDQNRDLNTNVYNGIGAKVVPKVLTFQKLKTYRIIFAVTIKSSYARKNLKNVITYTAQGAAVGRDTRSHRFEAQKCV